MKAIPVGLAIAYGGLTSCAVVSGDNAELGTSAGIESAIINGIYESPIQLVRGRYEGEPFVPGGASRPTVTLLPSNIVFYRGDRFPEWRGDAFISGLAGLKLTRVSFNGDEIAEVATVVDALGRIRDVHEGPDGLLYLAITGGEVAPTPILRLEPL